MRVLIVEDDATLRAGLSQAIGAAGYEAICVSNGSHADTLVATQAFDLLILDLGLPGLDGLDVLARLRARLGEVNCDIPVLILSARSSMDARVRGLDRGADDYMIKPFDLAEFEARVRALLRREGSGTLKLGSFQWDWEAHRGRVDAHDIPLSPHETALVEHLLRRSGRIVPKPELGRIIGDEGVAAYNKVEVYIRRLRKKLSAGAVEIRNVRGLGYILRAEGGR